MTKQHHALTELQTSFSVFSDTIITSRNNPRIRQLRALLKRPERERTGLALIEGLRLVTEALQYPDLVHQFIVAPELLKSQHGLTSAFFLTSTAHSLCKLNRFITLLPSLMSYSIEVLYHLFIYYVACVK